jgi:PAS domain S-box-containing protein
MHALLTRQLKRHFRPGWLADPEMTRFLEAVEAAYVSADEERALLEHSLNLSSRELKARYDALQFDIAQRKRAENERDTFFQLSPDLLCILMPDFTFKQVNPSWERVLGYPEPELISRQLATLLHPDDVAKTLSELEGSSAKSGESITFQTRFRTNQGGYRFLWWTSFIDPKTLFVFCVVRDTTDQQILEAELAQAQKLEAVGQLASGIAHEINSPIQFVGDNLQFVRDSFAALGPVFEVIASMLSTGRVAAADVEALRQTTEQADLEFLREEIPTSLAEAKDGVRRVAELVRALKEFAHADQPDMSLADLNHAIERTIVLARHEVKYVADFEVHFGEIPQVQCHVGALNQVFLNLIINAGHAIEDRRAKSSPGDTQRGRITVSTRLEREQVVVAIKDTGCGIPPEIRMRVFEPFFTTKEVGRGSGQGLSLARSIVVDRHHGQLDFETVVNEGTIFFVRLPIAQPARP